MKKLTLATLVVVLASGPVLAVGTGEKMTPTAAK
jgi:hypothetical protein